MKPLLLGIDWATLQAAGDTLILDIARDEVELDEDWDDGSGWLAALAPHASLRIITGMDVFREIAVSKTVGS